jgi:hypothetical protein
MTTCLLIGVAPELVAVTVTVAVTGGGGPVVPVDPHAVQNIMERARVASDPKNRALSRMRFLFVERMPRHPGSSNA